MNIKDIDCSNILIMIFEWLCLIKSALLSFSKVKLINAYFEIMHRQTTLNNHNSIIYNKKSHFLKSIENKTQTIDMFGLLDRVIIIVWHSRVVLHWIWTRTDYCLQLLWWASQCVWNIYRYLHHSCTLLHLH